MFFRWKTFLKLTIQGNKNEEYFNTELTLYDFINWLKRK